MKFKTTWFEALRKAQKAKKAAAPSTSTATIPSLSLGASSGGLLDSVKKDKSLLDTSLRSSQIQNLLLVSPAVPPQSETVIPAKRLIQVIEEKTEEEKKAEEASGVVDMDTQQPLQSLPQQSKSEGDFSLNSF